jgi:hypothetical protein
MDWNKSPIQWKGNYTSQWAEAGTMPVVKQFVGDFVTNSGLSVGSCPAVILQCRVSDLLPVHRLWATFLCESAWRPLGSMTPASQLQVHIRDMGTYNDTLLGDVLSDFNPLQADDILLVSAACTPEFHLHANYSWTLSILDERERTKVPDPLAPLCKVVRVLMSLCASSDALQVSVQINWGAWYPRFAWNQNQARDRLI